ncbi:MAG: zinc metalloprotease HtpX [Promethearchaeota archaeon]
MISVLFGMLFAFFSMLGMYFFWQWYFIVGISLFIVFLQYLLSPLLIRWIYSIQWISWDTLKNDQPHLASLIKRVAEERGLRKRPKFGLIHDRNPNAFTFGWSKNTARLVITTGIMHFLDKHEQEAVVGHEMGHIVHNDFIVMTMVAAIPVVFYSIYQATFLQRRYARYRSSGRDDDAQAALMVIGLLSYLAYLVGQMISLIISRVREYWADDFSATTIEDPNYLSTALVKIAYGLVKEGDQGSQKDKAYSKVHAAKSLGIFDKRAASMLAFSSLGSSGVFSTDTITKAAAWDLHNPWARYYELFSSHPLPAKRIKALNKKCAEKNIAPKIDLSRTKEVLEEQGAGKSLVDEFIVDLFFLALPGLVVVGLVGLTIWWMLDAYTMTRGYLYRGGAVSLWLIWSAGVTCIGLAMLLKVRKKYGAGKNYKKTNVQELVGRVKVSPIRPVPCTIKGKLIGRGVPGLIFSEDMVLQDDTGFITLDYDFGIGFINSLFAIFRVNKLIGHEAKVRGWYRRAPIPYVQVDRMWVDGKRFRNFKKAFAFVLPIIVIVIGLVMLWFLALNPFWM